MTEHNNPVDIDAGRLKQYREPVEALLTAYRYRGQANSLPDLLRRLDPEERFVMSHVERETYLSIRTGMALFQAVADLLADKVGLKAKLVATPSDRLATDPTLANLRGFCHDFATFAASRYVSKRLDSLIRSEGVAEAEDRADLSDLGLSLDSTQPDSAVIRRLMAPIFAYLLRQADTGEAFESALAFAVFVKDVFDRYAELSRAGADAYPELVGHLRGYTFRVLDDFLILEGYTDQTVEAHPAAITEVSFQPIEAREIVGNRHAKTRIARYVERLALYDPVAGENPILELGGLAWTCLYDGLPGTGKSSLFRLAMTRLRDLAEAAGLPFSIFTVDQSIKDEFYGKTGKILLQRLSVTQDSKTLSMGVLDDIDLLTSSRDDAQGADNDITNILMQYLDGVFTVRRGNVINFAASNKPTGLDEALRNRFNDRVVIDGPTTAEDFADMVVILGGKLLDRGLINIETDYTPFATQIDLDAAPITARRGGGEVAAYMADRFADRRTASLLDFGRFMADLKVQNPRITGRSAKSILEAMEARSADFDVPPEWFGNRALFLDQPYERKVAMLAELYRPITPDILYQEAQRYFDSEARFAETEAEGQITRGYNSRMWDLEARLRFYEAQMAAGESGALARAEVLKTQIAEMVREKDAVIRRILARSGGAEG